MNGKSENKIINIKEMGFRTKVMADTSVSRKMPIP